MGLVGSEDNLKLLIAEDNEINARMAKRMLTKLGFQVDVVENGEGAINAVRDGMYHFVLMDIQMPGIDGKEATKWILDHKNELLHCPQIIAMTANTLPHDQAIYFEIGMVDIIPKPLELDTIRKKLSKWTSRFK